MERKLFWFVLGFLLAIALGLLIFGNAEAQDSCNVFNDPDTGDDLISDDTVPYPNTSHCDEHGEIRLVCGHIETYAFEDGYFFLVSDNGFGFEYWMSAGDYRSFSVPEGAAWVQLWHTQDIIGIVDIIEQECPVSDAVYPPDDRVNWQSGDSFFAAYVEGNWLFVYATGSGVGELILATQEPACSEDGSACLYLLEDGTYQLNLIDWEGKLYEIPIVFGGY
jgi:hypothetical protein